MDNKIKIEVNQNCGKCTASTVLQNLGYDPLMPEYNEEGKTIYPFKKDGKKYIFDSWDHYNGYIYSITLKAV
jgi:hypothetical protein